MHAEGRKQGMQIIMKATGYVTFSGVQSQEINEHYFAERGKT